MDTVSLNDPGLCWSLEACISCKKYVKNMKATFLRLLVESSHLRVGCSGSCWINIKAEGWIREECPEFDFSILKILELFSRNWTVILPFQRE